MAIDVSVMRDRLLAMKAEIERDEAISAGERSPVTLDQASVGRLSRMDAMQQQAMALAAQQRRQTELARINAALLRIERDEFGYCLSCGDEIAEARLAHNPAVTTCIACAG